MMIDNFDSNFDKSYIKATDKLRGLNSLFESRYAPEYQAFLGVGPNTEANLVNWLGIDPVDTLDKPFFRDDTPDIIKKMYIDSGIVPLDGTRALTLSELSTWQLDTASPFYDTNLKQQAGYAAELLSTAKDNIIAKAKGKDVTTYRPDQKPGYFSNNDPYVDKFRIDNKTGEVIERIQVKFVGNDADGCLKKLVSKKYDKYINDGKVDKLEVPKEY